MGMEEDKSPEKILEETGESMSMKKEALTSKIPLNTSYLSNCANVRFIYFTSQDKAEDQSNPDETDEEKDLKDTNAPDPKLACNIEVPKGNISKKKKKHKR